VIKQQRHQRGVAMVEFALVAGLFFTLVMLLLDVGKAVYVKNTIDAAARDGARTAVALNAPTLAQIEAAVKRHSSDVAFASPCPFKDPTTATPANNTGEIYIDKMPEGGPGGVSLAGCGAITITTASGHTPIKITIVYKYQPITPFVSQFIGGGLTFKSSSTMTTEY
jgi:hypothetical protein